MIETGIITAVDGNKASVKVNPAAGCGSCAAKSHCTMESGGHRSVTVQNAIGASIGDRVEFTAKGGHVLMSAALVWLFPIMAMIAGYIIGEMTVGGGWSIAWAFAFLLLAGVLLHLFDRLLSRNSLFCPEITKILGR